MAKVDAHQPLRMDQMIALLVCKRLFDGVCHGSAARRKEDLECSWPHESDSADRDGMIHQAGDVVKCRCSPCDNLIS